MGMCSSFISVTPIRDAVEKLRQEAPQEKRCVSVARGGARANELSEHINTELPLIVVLVDLAGRGQTRLGRRRYGVHKSGGDGDDKLEFVGSHRTMSENSADKR